MDEEEMFRIKLAMSAPPKPAGIFEDFFHFGLWESAMTMEGYHKFFPYPQKEIDELSESDRKIFDEWEADPISDLPEHLSDIQMDIRVHQSCKKHRMALLKEADEAQWKFYWADMMIHFSKEKFNFEKMEDDS